MVKKFAQENKEMTLDIIRDLCAIPAPSFGEAKRAAYCKKWLEDAGAEGVYIDCVNNVLFPLGCEGSDEITVIMAHLDTVFPDTVSYPEYRETDACIHCPGVGDNTARVAAMMMTAKYLIDNGIKPEKGILFVCNACEEGLGNLVGVKQVMADFAGRVRQFISIDASIGNYVDGAVGSHRYEVEVRTEGGHSFGNFGNKNAIHALAEIIGEIYAIDIPQKEGTKTTLNVGTIEGGTSVNTIAQNAKMLCEYRSNDRESLEIMRQKFEGVFRAARNERVEVNVTLVGNRPCKGEVDKNVERGLVEAYQNALREVTGKEAQCTYSSTDANIPMSLGIASIVIGACVSYGAHTREEYLEKASVVDGVAVVLQTVLALI